MGFRLVCFDLDGTIIENTTFIWATLHEKLGTDSKAREKAKEDFFAGKLSYHDWAVHDAQLWVDKDVSKQDILSKLSHLRLVKGARETIDELKRQGMKLAIISGSLDLALETVLHDYEKIFDDVYINRLVFDDGNRLTGIIPTEFDFAHKATALKEIARREGIPLSDTVFIGDHRNDIEAAKAAGLSIAFNCKSAELEKISDICISEHDLRKILPHLIR